MKQRCVLLVSVAMLLSGCAAIHDGSTTFGPAVREINRLPLNQVRGLVADQTVMTFDPGATTCYPVSAGKYTYSSCSTAPGHGTQIEYYAPNGKAFLWYPGNQRPVRSLWKLKKSGDRYKVCAQYPTSSYNPITKRRGGRWRCEDLAPYSGRIREIRKGDIFGLSSRKLPFVLSPRRTTFNALLSRQEKQP